jgi:hypothetical protein
MLKYGTADVILVAISVDSSPVTHLCVAHKGSSSVE